MSSQKETNVSKMKEHYGLALEEIKLRHTIKAMTSRLNQLEEGNRLLFLKNEMANHEKQLKTLRKLRLV